MPSPAPAINIMLSTVLVLIAPTTARPAPMLSSALPARTITFWSAIASTLPARPARRSSWDALLVSPTWLALNAVLDISYLEGFALPVLPRTYSVLSAAQMEATALFAAILSSYTTISV